MGTVSSEIADQAVLLEYVGKKVDMPRTAWTTERSLETLDFCIAQGGAYSIADAVSTLESYNGVLHLDSERRESLVATLTRVEEAPDDWARFTSRCDLAVDLLAFSLDVPETEVGTKPDAQTVTGLFNMTATLALYAKNRTRQRTSDGFAPSYSYAVDRLEERLKMLYKEDSSRESVREFIGLLSSLENREDLLYEFRKHFLRRNALKYS